MTLSSPDFQVEMVGEVDVRFIMYNVRFIMYHQKSTTHVKISQLVNKMCSQQACSKLVNNL
jgi:hypothetical protein